MANYWQELSWWNNVTKHIWGTKIIIIVMNIFRKNGNSVVCINIRHEI